MTLVMGRPKTLEELWSASEEIRKTPEPIRVAMRLYNQNGSDSRHFLEGCKFEITGQDIFGFYLLDELPPNWRQVKADLGWTYFYEGLNPRFSQFHDEHVFGSVPYIKPIHGKRF